MGSSESTPNKAPTNNQKPSYRRKVCYADTEETVAKRAAMNGTKDIEPPPFINVYELLSKNSEATKNLCEELKNRSYACIKVDSSIVKVSESLTEVAFKYLNQESEIKEKNIDPKQNNMGYVLIPGIREYIKIRTMDPDYLWPEYPQDFKSAYTEFHQIYSKIAITCFEILSEYIVYDPEPSRLIREDDCEAIKQVLEARSSLSMIKYFSLEQNTEVCDEHTDTGILTFITRTNRPSLEIWDRKEKKYVKIEELLEVGDIVVFISEKVPLLSCSMTFSAAHHRVRMSAGPERLSIAYLLDVAL